jgi:hypothetical protein
MKHGRRSRLARVWSSTKMNRHLIAMTSFVTVLVLQAPRSVCAQYANSLHSALAEHQTLIQGPRLIGPTLFSPPALRGIDGRESQTDDEPLPPLDEELWWHGGTQLYAPEGDHLGWPGQASHHPVLRLPETYQAPQPLTWGPEFLGADPIRFWPHLRWPGADGYQWEPRLVMYGEYSMFGFAFEENNTRFDAVGHQLLVDADLRLTETERLHVQFRPIGEGNSGGSYYRINAPAGYIDNSTGVPDRWWLEFELASVMSGFGCDPFVPRDFHVVAGKFPFLLQNGLLMNDDILGVVCNKNTLYLGGLSNLNVQLLYAPDDVDAFTNGGAQLCCVNVTADWRRVLWEFSYASLWHKNDPTRNSHFAALAVTKHLGTTTLTGRALFKMGDAGGRGAGQLFVIETNHTRVFTSSFCHWAGLEHGVFYLDAFRATEGWNSISGGNYDRLRTAFSVNPLVPISAARDPQDTTGVAMGVQLFRCHEDQSLTPEVAYETPGGASVWGAGLTYQRKTSRRTFFEATGVLNWSSDPTFRREGVMLSETIVF